MAPRMKDKTGGAQALKRGCLQCKCLMSLQSFLLQHTFLAARRCMSSTWWPMHFVICSCPFWSRIHNAPSTKSLPMSIPSYQQEQRIHYNVSAPSFHRQVEANRLWRSTREIYTSGCQLILDRSFVRNLEVSVNGRLQNWVVLLKPCRIHRMTQFFCFFFFFFCLGGWSTTLMAASNTAFTFCKKNSTQKTTMRQHNSLEMDKHPFWSFRQVESTNSC